MTDEYTSLTRRPISGVEPDVLDGVELVAGVDAFGRVTGEEVAVHLQAADALDHGDALVFGDAGVDGRFIYDDVAFADYLADGFRCAIEGRQVGVVVLVDGSGNSHDIEVGVLDSLDVGGAYEAVVGDGVLQQLVADFEGSVVPCHEGFAALGVHVEADGLIFCGEETCERKAHIPEAYHADFDFFFHFV